MNKLLTLITVCICCISILGLKLRLDIYVHDKNEVITTMANKSNEDDFVYDPSKYGWWDTYVSGKAEEDRLKAERAKQRKFFTSKEDILNAVNEQIRANKNIRFRNNSHNLSLFRLAQIQSDILYGDPKQKIIHDLALAIPQSDDMSYTDMLNYYLNSDGINPDNVQDIISDILHYTYPLLKKHKGVLDPKNISEDITKRLQDFYRKVWHIHQLPSGKDKINQFRELVNTPDFDDFYGSSVCRSRIELRNLTHKVPTKGAEDEPLDNDYYQQYLKEVEDINAMPIALPTEDTSNSKQLPSLNDILGNANPENPENQENQENQEEDVVEAPEGESINPQEDTLPIQDTQSVQGYQDTPNGTGAILNAALSNAGPMYALNITPGLYGEKYEAFAKALREYALKNGIVSDTPKDPESFKPYIPDFYV